MIRLNQIQEQQQDYLAKTAALIEFKHLIRKPTVNAVEIVEVLEKDTSLVAELLRKSNSPIYGLVKKVKTIQQAIAVIGLDQVAQIFTLDTVQKMLLPEVPSGQAQELWKHSVAVAVATRHLASLTIKKRYWEEYFLAGLLHDIGKFIIIKHLPDVNMAIEREMRMNPGMRQLVAEQSVMSMTHQEIGAFFTEMWNFPDYLVSSIRHHHFFELAKSDKAIVAAVTAGNNIAKAMMIGDSGNKYVEPLPRWVWQLLGIQPKDFDMVVRMVYRQYNGVMNMFDF